MDVVVVRLLLYSILPLLLGFGIILLDRSASNRLRRLEAVLIPLFAVGVAGSGIGGFVAHFFLSDAIAASIGWAAGSPFQLEIAFANLSIGVLGAVAADRRDGFREATVVAASVFGVGATIVHLMDIAETGNLAPGNTIQNAANLIRPAFLIALLVMIRRAERQPNAETLTLEFAKWRHAILRASLATVIIVSMAFAAGFGLDRVVVVSLLGVLLAVAVTALVLSRSPDHRAPNYD